MMRLSAMLPSILPASLCAILLPFVLSFLMLKLNAMTTGAAVPACYFALCTLFPCHSPLLLL